MADSERSVLPLEAKKRILRERADKLAREIQADTATDHDLEVVEFMLAHERYGIESVYIREVYPLKDYTPIPCTPAFVMGIINFRGQMLSIIDLRMFFDLPGKGMTDLNRVIILHGDMMEFGILADEIKGVRRVSSQAMQTSLTNITGLRDAYIKGVTPDRLIVLDAERILGDKSIIVHEEVDI